MAPNFHENIFVKFGIALCITKILASKILVFHVFSSYEYFKAVSNSLLLPNEKFPVAIPFHLYIHVLTQLANCGKSENYLSHPIQSGTYAKFMPKQKVTMLYLAIAGLAKQPCEPSYKTQGAILQMITSINARV